MVYNGNSNERLQFYNPTNNGYEFLGGDVYNNGSQLQPVSSGSTRPSGVPVGFAFLDLSITPKPHIIWYIGASSATGWIDASGNDA